MKSIVAIVLGFYLSIGLTFGLLLERAMPALNWKGVTYITLTWPAQLKVSPVRAPIPSWVFSFEAEK